MATSGGEISHLFIETMAFGGVGPAGMGHYYGFDPPRAGPGDVAGEKTLLLIEKLLETVHRFAP
jgi:hypothetical protein